MVSERLVGKVEMCEIRSEVYGASDHCPVVLEMAGPRGGYQGLKMYRWARRTSEWELNICLDRVPPQTDTNW